MSDRKDRENFKYRQNRIKRDCEKQAKKVLEDGSVVILIDQQQIGDIPMGAISVLEKGLGFVPTPELDVMDNRLDMRLTVNRILSSSKSNLKTDSTEDNNNSINSPENLPENSLFPQKLLHKNYYKHLPSEDREVNDIVNSMQTELDQLRQQKPKNHRKKRNLNLEEQKGLKWLQQNVNLRRIAILTADKGGSTLIVDPTMLRKKTLEKLESPQLYKKLQNDPLKDLHRELFQLWVQGKQNNFVSPEEAKYVMGLSEKQKKDESGPTNRPSTSPRYKPGKSYFYPSLKVHKLKKEDLKPGVEPPIKLISALQDGISKRSDVFIAAKFLRNIEKDFCDDLLTDTTDAILWLDQVNNTYPKNLKMQLK